MEYELEYELEITDLTVEGFGIGKTSDGFTLFVEGGVPGDIVLAKVYKAKKAFAYATISKLIKPSHLRQTPECSVFNECGGCCLQHINYEAQLDFKHKKVKDSLKRIGGISLDFEVIAAENRFNYRNNVQFPVGQDENGVFLGFYSINSHSVVRINRCLIAHESHEQVLQIIEKFFNDYKISTYNRNTKKGLVRHVAYRIGFKTNEKLVCIVINGKTLPNTDKLIERLQNVDGLKSICVNINTGSSSVVFGKRTYTIWGSETICDYIGQYKFNISPTSFFQINPVQTEILYNKIVEFASPLNKEKDIVADLFCGTGTISIFMAHKAKAVYGIEIFNEAVLNAQENASQNSILNAHFIQGAAEHVFLKLSKEICPDVIIVDPPRKGCDINLLKQLSAKKIIYVSCDHATLSRDLKILAELGYNVVKGALIDCFCMTMRLECVVLIERP